MNSFLVTINFVIKELSKLNDLVFSKLNRYERRKIFSTTCPNITSIYLEVMTRKQKF